MLIRSGSCSQAIDGLLVNDDDPVASKTTEGCVFKLRWISMERCPAAIVWTDSGAEHRLAGSNHPVICRDRSTAMCLVESLRVAIVIHRLTLLVK